MLYKKIWKKTKMLIKRIFNIKREGFYRTFAIGQFKIKQSNKKWLKEILKEYDEKIMKAEEHIRASNLKLKKINEKIEESKAENNELRILNHSLTEENNILRKESDTVRKENDSVKKENDSVKKENKGLKEDLERIRKLFETVETRTKDFYPTAWTTGWVDVWRQYYCEHYNEIEDKLSVLKRFLDEESIATIDRLCYRNFQLLPLQKDSDLFLYNYQRIYTQEELQGVVEPMDDKLYREKYVLSDNIYLETPVFKFQCGLSCLPDAATSQIKDRDIIDGGAYWGDSALVLQEFHPKMIYAFEPQPDTYIKLNETINNNHLESAVVAIQAGLGAKEEKAELFTSGMISGSNIRGVEPLLSDVPRVVNNIDILTIDDYVEQHGLDVGFIKLDIEGNELQAIYGAQETIKKCRPVLGISVYHTPQDMFEVKPFIETLGLGYKFIVRKLVYHDLVTEVMLLGYVDRDEEDAS